MTFKVLILEDNELDAGLMEQSLHRSGYDYDVTWVRSGEEYEEALTAIDPDVIISDYRLKQYSGLDAVRYKNLKRDEIPLVVVSGTIGEEKAVELIREGAADFLIKNNIDNRLAQTVTRAIKEAAEKEKRRVAEVKMKLSDERFRLLFENSLDGIFITDPLDDERVLAANRSVCHMLGYELDELKQLSRFDIMGYEADGPGRRSEDSGQLDEFRGEIIMRRKEGSSLPVEVSTRRKKYSNGRQRSYHIIRDISDRRKYERNLKNEKEFIAQALDSLPGLFYMLDENQNFVRINKNLVQDLGYTWEEVQQMNPLDFYDEADRKRVAEEIQKAFTEGEASMVTRIRRKDGSTGHYHLTGVHMERDGINYIMGTGIDISDRIEAENRVREALHEKEVLLAEVHHRVKNNLAVVSGMMQLQAFKSEDELLRSKLLDSVSRIKSIALIHEYLYQDESLSKVVVSSNIRELTEKIEETLNLETEVEHVFNIQEITLNVNQAVPFALIFNEVITNIYKHAFREMDRGRVTISVKEENEMIWLEVRDNGQGLPEGFDFHKTDTLGLTLINTLSRQLSAAVNLEQDEETTFTLEFRKSEAVGSADALKSRR